MTTQDTDTAQDQAKAQLEGIREMLDRFHHAQDGNCVSLETNEFCDLFKASDVFDLTDFHDEELARQAIEEDPLSVETRSGWHSPGETSEDTEYCILLCTGGPAVRIIGELGLHGDAASARLQYQDWFTPWTEYITTGADHAALIEYANFFLGF